MTLKETLAALETQGREADASGKWCNLEEVNFRAHLAQAYRTGQLVVAPSVEEVVDTLLEGLSAIGFMDPMWDGSKAEIAPIARAILTSMGAKT